MTRQIVFDVVARRVDEDQETVLHSGLLYEGDAIRTARAYIIGLGYPEAVEVTADLNPPTFEFKATGYWLPQKRMVVDWRERSI